MTESTFVERLKAFLQTGKSTPPTIYQPGEVDTEMQSINAILAAGLDATHLKETLVVNAATDNITLEMVSDKLQLTDAPLRLLVFTGAAAPGECALAGAKVDDVVIGVINLTTPASATSSFETAITVANKIVQSSVVDLSLEKFGVLLIARS